MLDRKRIFIVLIMLGLLVVSLPAGRVHADDLPVLRVQVPVGTYNVGDLIPVEVRIDNVTDLYGADVKLSFSADLFTVIDADSTIPGVQVLPEDDLLQPDFVVRNEANNTTGTIWYAVSQINPTLPASGSGVLFSFVLQAKRGWGGGVDISQYTLADSDALPIEVVSQGAIIHVNGTGYLHLPLVVRAP